MKKKKFVCKNIKGTLYNCIKLLLMSFPELGTLQTWSAAHGTQPVLSIPDRKAAATKTNCENGRMDSWEPKYLKSCYKAKVYFMQEKSVWNYKSWYIQLHTKYWANHKLLTHEGHVLKFQKLHSSSVNNTVEIFKF